MATLLRFVRLGNVKIVSGCLERKIPITFTSSVRFLYTTPNFRKRQSDFADLDQPIKFTTSEASQWSSEEVIMNVKNRELPKYQPFAIIFSVACFLIYFCILREENDIDEGMSQTLWQRIPGLERKQLKVLLNYNKERGLSVVDIEKRLEELDVAEQKHALKVGKWE